MEKIVLNAEVRVEVGKTKVKKLRNLGFIPAVVYKGGKEAIHIKAKKEDIFHLLHTAAGENVLITLKIVSDKKSRDKTCLIKEVQRDPVKDDVIHIDLNEISLTEKIEVKVPVHPHGEAEGVVADGGVLDHVLWELEVECLPTDIPQKITVEVAAMKIGDTVYVKDLVIPPGVKVLSDPELTVMSVVPPAKEEVPEAVPEGEELTEPEVIAKGKKDEEEIEGEAPEGKPAKEEKPKKPEVPPAKQGKKE